MIKVSWSNKVNQKFYGVEESLQDNSTSSEYTSGRKAVFLKNSRFVKEYTCKLSLNVKSGEYKEFLNWFTDTLGGLSNAFTCSALGSGYYRFKSTPTFSVGQLFKEASLEIEEVY